MGCVPPEDKPVLVETGGDSTHSESTTDTERSWWYPDSDGDGHGSARAGGIDAVEAPDGFVASNDDCDDDDAAVYPGATERCNGVDDDCDGTVDEPDAVDASTWYRDADGDGYGVAEDRTPGCEVMEGYTSEGGDCDDGSAAVNPAATETCNGVDDNCDGLIDGEDVASTWYRDADGDGYGDPLYSLSTSGCDEPDGYVGDALDCDDEDPAISPDAEEVCDNEIDEDCSGTARDCGLWGEHELAGAHAIYRGDEAYGRVSPALEGGDADGDGRGDLWIGDYMATERPDLGALYLIAGPTTEDAVLREVADATIITEHTEQGVVIHVSPGDVDGDGYDDLWAAIQYGSGSEWLCLVLPPVVGTLVLEETAETCWEADPYSDLGFNYALDAGQDLNDDGEPDVVAGEAWYGAHHGAFFYLYGDDATGPRDATDAPVFVQGAEGEEFAMHVAQVPDSNGDGQPDVLAGVIDIGGTGTYTGGGFLVEDPLEEGSYTAADVGTYLGGTSAGDMAGFWVAGTGDLNGDGYGDFAVGAGGATDSWYAEGKVYVFSGPLEARDELAEADAILCGGAENVNAAAVEGAKDVDGDGTPDLVIGGYGAGPEPELDDPGHVWLVHGPPATGTWSLTDADAVWVGESGRDQAGLAVSLIEDTNADGYDDILVSAPYESSLVKYGGAAYLLLGGPF